MTTHNISEDTGSVDIRTEELAETARRMSAALALHGEPGVGVEIVEFRGQPVSYLGEPADVDGDIDPDSDEALAQRMVDYAEMPDPAILAAMLANSRPADYHTPADVVDDERAVAQARANEILSRYEGEGAEVELID